MTVHSYEPLPEEACAWWTSCDWCRRLFELRYGELTAFDDAELDAHDTPCPHCGVGRLELLGGRR